MRILVTGLAALATFAAAPAAATTIITNVPAWNGVGTIQPFGGFSVHYGQTFVSPGDYLKKVTFQLVRGDPRNFNMLIAPWDVGARALAGPALFESALTYFDGTAGAYSFDVNIPTTAGNSYIAYINSAGMQDNSSLVFVGATGNTIPNGNFYFFNSFFDNRAVAGQAWNGVYSTLDLAFAAEFAPVPEPATWAMLIAGFGLIGFTARRHRPASARTGRDLL